MFLFKPRLRAQLIKEFLSILRDPKSRLVLIGPPLMQLMIFSFAATLDVRNAQLAVFDRDGGPRAQELIVRLDAAAFTGKLQLVDSRSAVSNTGFHPEQAFRRLGLSDPADILPLYIAGFRQPKVLQENVSLLKQFEVIPVGERSVKAILRADFFNFLNRNVFNVNMSIGNANFGRATSPNLQPRFVTMGMRLEF